VAAEPGAVEDAGDVADVDDAADGREEQRARDAEGEAREGGPEAPDAVEQDDERERRDLWLVWSGTRVAVVAADTRRSPRILWQADDAAQHDIAPSSGAIDFADGSTVSFVPSDAELDRLREYDDRP